MGTCSKYMKRWKWSGYLYDNGIEDGEFKRCWHLWRVSIDICNLVFLYTEDHDTTTEELSTSDISSEGLEVVMNKSYDSDYSDIGITQTSEGSANKVSILKMYTVAKLMGFIEIDSVQTSMCLCVCVCVFVYVHPCLQWLQTITHIANIGFWFSTL